MKYKTIKLNEKQLLGFKQAAEALYEEYGDEDMFKEQLRLLGIEYDSDYWL